MSSSSGRGRASGGQSTPHPPNDPEGETPLSNMILSPQRSRVKARIPQTISWTLLRYHVILLVVDRDFLVGLRLIVFLLEYYIF
ncbi:hypothetical protein BVRB_8g187730 [Beta vulgaris subsp. vulgaris]|uniref:Uncharacterized protein n=1 Tax=Beta vulgaris subsp. vulgaris TaxID=3555 RepID=A0A0J8BQY8_BETVV|nr:hypothetical protein BVRB_8g187730 [Beta vulgaris subsp. vulgaris]